MWRPRLADSTSANFFLLDFVRGLVYKQNDENLDQLQSAIITQFQQVTQDMLVTAMNNFVKRLRNLVAERNGIGRLKCNKYSQFNCFIIYSNEF